MVAVPQVHPHDLNPKDQAELDGLVNAVALSEHSLVLYAIAPESAPDHPVVEGFRSQVTTLGEPLQLLTFFYSDNSLFNFLATLDTQAPPDAGRRVVLAFGLEQLPTPRLKQELEQLNLAREKIFAQNLVLVFWLNRDSFLDEFRNRAPDFWDWRGKVAMFGTRHPLLYPYLEWLIAENSYLTMSGVMQVNRQVDIFLDQIYVSLKAERRQKVSTTSHQRSTLSKSKSSRPIGSMSRGDRDEALEYDFSPGSSLADEEKILGEDISTTKIVTEKVDLADVVRGNYACSVILGAPGSGKTTLLKYLALHFAKALRDKQDIVQAGADQDSLGQTRWPIYFKIADYAEHLEQQPDLGLLAYLKQFYRNWVDYFDGNDASALPARLLEQLQMGNCLILLDGLDEVFDQHSRRQIVERINAFAEEFGHNKLIVTSRVAGYQDAKLASRFTEFTIADMSDQQVSDFLYRWCRAVEQAQKPDATAEQQKREGDQQAERILSDIQKSEGVKRLTTNPLLLTILALIHRNGEQLPARRVKLYELAVQTLTADWQLSKKLPNMQKVLLPEGEVVALLAPLAYWMHEEKPSGQVTHAEVIEQLAPRLAELRGEAADSPEILTAVEEFLRRVRETTGLFVERAPKVYGFMHLTFEEYFAARDIADKDPAEILETIQQHWHEPRWVEPILLALGYYGSYSPRQFNRLIEKLFQSLKSYQPVLGTDDIKILGGGTPDAKIRWSQADSPDDDQEFPLQDLLFAGQVIAQVGEVQAQLRRKIINQLIVTLLALPEDLDDLSENLVKQVLQLLRQVEQFNQQAEVVASLQQFTEDSSLSKEIRLRARVTKFYVLCSEASTSLIDCITELTEAMEPDLFCALGDLMNNLGEDISPALDVAQQEQVTSPSQPLLTFFTGMSYVREKHYGKAVELFKEVAESLPSALTPYTHWALATCYEKQEDYNQANDCYQICSDNLAGHLVYWRNRGICQRLDGKYEQALECFQRMLDLAESNQKLSDAALAFYHFGRTYQAWSKYEDAITYNEQSLDRYQQLGKEANVANQWFWMADCYRDWGHYEQALAAEQQELSLRQKLDDQSGIADAYYQLGRIYQDWGKYGEAITYHEQSRDIYQQLGKEIDIALAWCWIANCYRDWGHYEQALAAEQQELALRQKLDDQPGIASAYYRLGRIYQAWGKYGEAINHYEQSRDRYQQLGKEANVANLWYWLATCYRDWGQYKQALAAEQQELVLRQKLDDQPNIADAYYQLGRIYQTWGKYDEAITHYKQGLNLAEKLDLRPFGGNQLSWLAACYRRLDDYPVAIEYYQKSFEQHHALGDNESAARRLRQLANTQRLQAKNSSPNVADSLLQQAEDNLQQAMQLDTAGDYSENLAYDQFAMALLIAEQLRCLPLGDNEIPEKIRQFEDAVSAGFDRFAQLGQVIDQADEALDIARAYLEIEPLRNLDRAETLARQSLQTFQEFNRRKLQAAANRLLGEIYQARAQAHEADAGVKANDFLAVSLSLYDELGLMKQATEVRQLL